MNNNEMFDYYGNVFSYMKIIMGISNNKKREFVVKEIFNEKINQIDSNIMKDELYKMIIFSSLFEKKLNQLSDNKKKKYISDINSCYIEPMILNYINGEQELVDYFFEALKNKIIVFSGFLGLFEDSINIINKNKKI